jgi:hypothetical protein
MIDKRLLILGLILLGVTGCDPTPKRLPVYKVTGSMFWESKAIEGAMIIFHPQNGEALSAKLRPSAIVQKDGSFAPTNYNHGDGLPKGEYLLTIFWPLPSNSEGAGETSANRLPSKFDKPETSGLKVIVENQPLSLAPFYLQP